MYISVKDVVKQVFMKKFRIKRTTQWVERHNGYPDLKYAALNYPTYLVQMKMLWFWITIKKFSNPYMDANVVREKAEKCLSILNDPEYAD